VRQEITVCKEHPMKKSIVGPALIALVLACSVTQAESKKATVVLVHGAFAERLAGTV
jgi:hypothetical protein